MALALAFTQVGCQAPPPTSRITVASAGRISSLDPAQASTLSATQLISALGDPLYRLTRDGSPRALISCVALRVLAWAGSRELIRPAEATVMRLVGGGA